MVGGYSGGNSFCRTYACTNSSSCRIAAALRSPGAIARAIGGFEEDGVVLVDPVLDFGGHGAAVAEHGLPLLKERPGGFSRVFSCQILYFRKRRTSAFTRSGYSHDGKPPPSWITVRCAFGSTLVISSPACRKSVTSCSPFRTRTGR